MRALRRRFTKPSLRCLWSSNLQHANLVEISKAAKILANIHATTNYMTTKEWSGIRMQLLKATSPFSGSLKTSTAILVLTSSEQVSR